MTIREEVKLRIERDTQLERIRKKIERGKASYTDTATYSIRAGKLTGEMLAQHLPDVPLDEREQLCVDLLHDRYIDINAAVDSAQKVMDEAKGLHLAPQRAPFNSERAQKIGSSIRDVSKDVETQKRRARAATETATKAMHDDRMEAEAKFRSGAGLKCYITRVSVGGCCKWCTKVAGRYEYGSEPEDIFRRHDNCDCTVTYENGRERQDVWSKKAWTVPEDAGASEPVRFTQEQAAAAGAEPPKVFTESEGRATEQRNLAQIRGLTSSANDGKIKSEDTFNCYGDYLRDKMGSALENQPDEVRDIVDDVVRLGGSVEFLHDNTKMVCNVALGEPGHIEVDENISIGGLKHEYRHFLDDMKNGNPGLGYYLRDKDVFFEYERRGYMEELLIAEQNGYDDVADKIRGEIEKRRREIYGK